MSSSPTAPTSTTGSSTSSPSPADPREDVRASVALVACGALAQPCAEVVARRGWPVDVVPLPPLLHNHPERIAVEVERVAEDLQQRYATVVVGYADCGTYGALDEVCDRRGLARLEGLHCYDLYGGAERLQAMFEAEPGTYVLTDFLVRSFDRTVVAELGLDRYPELRDDYFGHYTRLVWLAQQPDEDLRARAERAARLIGLPLTEVPTGHSGLEHALEELLHAIPAGQRLSARNGSDPHFMPPG
jgi:hypothetical protein